MYNLQFAFALHLSPFNCEMEKITPQAMLKATLIQFKRTPKKQIIQPLNSQKWLTCTSNEKYPYIIQQTGNKKTQTNQAEDVILISQQILITN